MSLQSINPANGEEIKSYSEQSFSDIKEILNSSNLSQKLRSETKVQFRLECLSQLTGILRDNKLIDKVLTYIIIMDEVIYPHITSS